MENFISILGEFVEKMSQIPNKAQQKESQELLDLAVADLTSSRLLYDGGIYNNAIYKLHHAVEKAAKSFYKITGLLDDKEIRNTSHDSPELFLRMVEQPWAQGFAHLLVEVTGTDMVTDTSAAQSAVDKNVTRVEIARLNEEQIGHFIKIIQPIAEQMQPFSAFMNIHYVTATLRLYLLSAIMFPHARFTQYANYEVKPKEYTMELGVVKSIQTLWEQTEIAINEVKDIIEYMTEKDKG